MPFRIKVQVKLKSSLDSDCATSISPKANLKLIVHYLESSLRIRSCKLYIHFPGLCGDTLCDIIAIRNQYEEKGDENNKRYPAL